MSWQKTPKARIITIIGNDSTSVSLDTSTWALKAYDKKMESIYRLGIDQYQELVASTSSKEYLRIELIIKRNIKKQLRLTDENTSPLILCNPDIYERLLHRWEQHYFRVPKGKVLLPNFTDKLNPSQFIRMITGLAINEYGLTKIESYISILRKKGLMDKFDASRARRKIRSIANDCMFFKSMDTSNEVDNLVRTMVSSQMKEIEHYRMTSITDKGSIA